MYRIVKRIIRTVTTVTLLVRWEKDVPGQEAIEIPITLPASYSLTEEEVVERKNKSKQRKKSKPILNNGSKGGQSIGNRTTTTQTADEPPDEPYS